MDVRHVIYVDVDDTLIRTFGTKQIPKLWRLNTFAECTRKDIIFIVGVVVEQNIRGKLQVLLN